MKDDDDRIPPKRVRISKLQEVQIGDLVKLDHACSEMYWELGFDAAEVPARMTQEFYKLPRDHAVRVAEADYVVAGYTAFRDEAPGVAYLEELSVHPDYQRFGIGAMLLESVYEEARDKDLKEIVLRTWDKAEWARAFYAKLGFVKIDESAPLRVRDWLASKTEGDRPFLRPGESVLWRAIPKAPVVEEESDEDEDVAPEE
jgi:amino-acid N-acetyltransferase